MGLFSRFRRNSARRSDRTNVKKRENTPSPSSGLSQQASEYSTHEALPEAPLPSITTSAKSKDSHADNDVVYSKSINSQPSVSLSNPRPIPILNSHSRVPVRETVTLDRPPTAKEAAMKGPPRYDWIDIETAAAIKVQAAYRRCKVMSDLEKRGLSTAAIRNRSRRREVKHEYAGSEDIPSLLSCCGVGLAFGDATEEDHDARRAYQKALYEEKKKQREAKEEKLRLQFLSKQTAAKRNDDVEESYEVVEE